MVSGTFKCLPVWKRPDPTAAIDLLDRGYLDFARLYLIQQGKAFFVTRAKPNTRCERISWHPVDKTTGLVCDQTVRLVNYCAAKVQEKNDRPRR